MSLLDKRPDNNPSRVSVVLAALYNLVLVYVVYFICRVFYVVANWHTFGGDFGNLSLWELLKGSLLFDTSAILYTNSLYIVLMFLPLHLKESVKWQKVTRWLYYVVNSLAVIINLVDAVYFTYTGRRTTSTVFSEFSNETNLWSIVGMSIINYWYLVLTGVILIFSLVFFYVTPASFNVERDRKSLVRYYTMQVLCFVVCIYCCVAGMRGGFTRAVRPITLSNANQYVNRPTEAAIVLNTPFSLIRSTGKNVFYNPNYFTEKQLNRIYSPIHNAGKPYTNQVAVKRNVVVLIVESFGREYIAEYNDLYKADNYKGYAPFMDSMVKKSLTFDYTFANGRKSIDGMPSILSGIPHFLEPFFLTPASLNTVSGLAGELGKCGYTSAFFHGAENGSMGFEAFAKTTGFQKYYGRTEFNEDKRFGGDKDFDGTWAIWDEPFLQYYAMKMTEMKQPFVTAVFTASSHHPYVIPEKYNSKFDILWERDNPIHKCIRYTDMALRKFFETAKKQPWYKNTIFVITSDHTNIYDHQEYGTDLGLFGAPILIYDPLGDIEPGRRHCIAQQTDIMPTVLSYLGYSNPYLSFGVDLLTANDSDTWAVNYSNGIYQFVKGDYVIQFDGRYVTGAFNYKDDWFMLKNLKSSPALKPQFQSMETQLKAIIQSYMTRMVDDRLVPDGAKSE